MIDRRYIIDEEPVLFTFMDILKENMANDAGQLNQDEIVNLTRLSRDNSLPLGHCQVRRVI